jgi:hypothetical protein
MVLSRHSRSLALLPAIAGECASRMPNPASDKVNELDALAGHGFAVEQTAFAVRHGRSDTLLVPQWDGFGMHRPESCEDHATGPRASADQARRATQSERLPAVPDVATSMSST